MSGTTRTSVEGGVRRYLRRTPAQRVTQALAARRLGLLGDGAFIERGVEFLRHPESVMIGRNVIVKSGARVCPTNPKATVTIGDWSTIGYHTHIFATSSITIGDNCLVAPFCYLVDANHGTERGSLIREQPMSVDPIVIDDDVWLGAGVTVLPGVTIGRGAVVGASSVVTRDIDPYAIVSGVPAVQVSERKG